MEETLQSKVVDWLLECFGEKGTVRFLRPINGTVNIVSRFKPQGAKSAWR